MRKKILIMNHYATSMFFDHGGRHYYFAKYLIQKGYEVTIFCASTVHNSDKNIVIESGKYMTDSVDGIPYVFVKTPHYTGNGKQRIKNMVAFYRNLFPVTKKYAEKYGRPDVILASSVHPLTLVAGIRIAKKWKIPCICEIRDLWPETLVAYGIKKQDDIAIKLLYKLEKWIYMKANAIIFTMKGGYDYVIDRGWEKEIPRSKVYFINNGIDLEVFDFNKKTYWIEDFDVNNLDTIKIIYTGSIRKANTSIMILPEVSKILQEKGFENLKIIVYGKGEYTENLRSICEEKNINNFIIKGYVDKKYIPYILSKGDINILNCDSSDVMKYGGSQNKLFEYLASGHPIISGENNKYSIIKNRNCGISKYFNSAEEIADSIINLINNPIDSEYIRSVGEEYDFKILTDKLLEVVQNEEYLK